MGGRAGQWVQGSGVRFEVTVNVCNCHKDADARWSKWVAKDRALQGGEEKGRWDRKDGCLVLLTFPSP